MMNLFLTTLAACAVILTIASEAPEKKRAYGMCYANGYVHQNGDVFTMPGGSHCIKYRCMNGQVNFHEQMCELEGKCYPVGVNFVHNCVTYICQKINRTTHFEMRRDVVRYDCQDYYGTCRRPGSHFPYAIRGYLYQRCTCSIRGRGAVHYSCSP